MRVPMAESECIKASFALPEGQLHHQHEARGARWALSCWWLARKRCLYSEPSHPRCSHHSVAGQVLPGGTGPVVTH